MKTYRVKRTRYSRIVIESYDIMKLTLIQNEAVQNLYDAGDIQPDELQEVGDPSNELVKCKDVIKLFEEIIQ